MIRRHLRFSVLLAVWAVGSSVLIGCTTLKGATQPDWVTGPSSQFPSEQYLVGVGQADTPQVAQERAYGAVAKIFKVQVTVQSKDWESFLLFENKGTTATERRLSVDHITNVSSDKALENVNVLESWTNRHTGQAYVLAGLNRAQSESALSQKIRELDRTVEDELEESRRAPEKLAKIRHLRRAGKTLVLRDAFNADLRVIRTSGQGTPAAHRLTEITTELERFLSKSFLIGVDVQGEQADVVKRAMMEGLVREGLPVTSLAGTASGAASAETGSQGVDLSVKGTVRVWAADIPDPRFKYARWCSDFLILDPVAQRVVGAVSKSGREGHLSIQEAMTKAVRVMQQSLVADLSKTLAGYVYGDVPASDTIPPAACPRDEAAGVGR
jgi:hypothetical protein